MENTGKLSMIISWLRFDGALVMTAIFLHYAGNDIKGQQVATGNKASWQQHELNVKTCPPNFCCALLSW